MLTSLLLLALSSAAIHAEEPAAPPVGTVEIHRALSMRDGAPPCAEVEALSPTPVEALLYVVDHASQPPWAGMRAATCLVERHAARIQPAMERWVVQPETQGLALLVLGRIDDLPAEVATSIARASLAGPLETDARSRLLRSARPEIRALVGEE